MSFLFSAILLIFSCQTDLNPTNDTPVADRVVHQELDTIDLQKKYKGLISYIQEKKSTLSNSRMEQSGKEKLAKEVISSALIDSMIPYWTGTPWDFNGISPEPRKGEIACGYFVSTTLLHLGVNLNRYKTAQKAASDIVKQLCEPSTIETCGSFDKLISYLADVPNNEILIVGLDFHVGFIFKKDDVVYFSHSNYINREGVIIEPLEMSKAIHASKAYVIGNVSQNKSLISNWLK